MIICEQLNLNMLLGSLVICEDAKKTVGQSSDFILAELKNASDILEKISTGATVHDIANVRQMLMGASEMIKRNGINSKTKEKAELALSRAVKHIKDAKPKVKKEFNKRSKGKNGSGIISFFHNMY